MSKLNKLQKQILARQVRKDEGVELTPDQAEMHLNNALINIRKEMIKRGYDMEYSDDELRQLIGEARRQR